MNPDDFVSDREFFFYICIYIYLKFSTQPILVLTRGAGCTLAFSVIESACQILIKSWEELTPKRSQGKKVGIQIL